MGHRKISAKRKVHSNTGLPQETRKKSNKNLTLQRKQLEKEEMKNPRVNRRKEILKIRAEINAKKERERERERPYQKSTKPKAGSLRR